jgi:flagellar hook-length control protein FliK
MDITLLQMTQKSISTPTQKQTQPANTTNETSFDKVFSEAVQTSSTKASNSDVKAENALTPEAEVAQVVDEVTPVLEAQNLETVLDILNVEHDDAMLFVVLEGELKPIEETMNVDDLSSMLNISAEELQQIVSQLTEQEVDVTDVWQVLEQSPQLLAQVTAVLQGESQIVSSKDAAQVVKFLQLTQLVGQKVDTVYSDEVKLVDTKQALQQFTTQLATSQQQPTNSTTTQSQFAQVMQQLTTNTTNEQVKTTETTETTETTPVSTSVQHTTQQQVRTVNVVLPTERSAQSEALVKEIQNQLNRAQISNNNGVIKLTMRLFPENLGQIRIEIMQQDGVLQARILATTSAGKELLDSNLSQLKSTLVAQNIQMDRVDIAQAIQTTDASKEQGFFNQFFKQPEQQKDVEEDEETSDEEVSFEEFLNEQLVLEEV